MSFNVPHNLMASNSVNYEGEAHFASDVLDRGFVALRNISGPTRRNEGFQWSDPSYLHYFDADDVDPPQSARMSFGKMGSETHTSIDDERLARYLMRNWHSTPFEMIEVWVEMKMPIFVARQFVRHRTATINEISGRYVQLEPHWYIPEIVGGQADNVKQGQADNLPSEIQKTFKARLNKFCEESYADYQAFIAMRVAHEHARMFLHLNHYTHWLWKQDLHNMMHFLRLRAHSHAQIEAQMYAQALSDHLRFHLPKSMQLFDEYRKF